MMAEVDIASHDLMTKETSRTEPKQESTSHTLSVPAPMRIKASSVNPSTNASASNNLSTTVHTTTNTAAIDLIGNPEDTSVDELEDLLNC
ncbi:hypothetical protein PGT21_023316 [Puccinia graminis f. sp. tritici]|uniref:Uncharacterized protein n=1 Tax=Puccinia graminis f. sp. tritici TaxID=56615 RepID=A0A5B0MUS0_PUCGR|nr:hypothetical protein PGT21_023316 [Puccinia graminis f. sp. tritici]